jgi:NTE family protein
MATPPVTSLPDALVLGAGGTLGIAWLRGLIAGLEEAAGLDLRRAEYFVGTSAGAYVAATLAAGHRVADPVADPGRTADAAAQAAGAPAPEDDEERGPLKRLAGEGGRVAAALTAPFVPLALSATRPGGKVVRAAVLRAAPTPRDAPRDLRRHSDRLGARFDGRLRIVTVDRKRGARVVFGAPGAPPATVAEAVLASCAVPWIFSPVDIGGREYVDGGVWSMSNLDVAPVGRGGEVLALLPIFGRGGGALSLVRTAAQAAGLAELQVLRVRGIRTRIVAPDAGAMEAMGPNLMNARRRGAVYDAAREQGRRLGGAAPAAAG